MRGIGGPVATPSGMTELEIVVEQEQFSIGRRRFSRPADKVLEMLTEEVLDEFGRLCGKSKRSLLLSPETCEKSLVQLAEWGRTAYQAFFEDEQASKLLAWKLNEGVAPTFVSELTPFPWEVLFGGTETDFEKGNPDCFWGFRYTPARILNPEKDVMDYPMEQGAPLDMLFCLHHRLVQAHQQERPEIERLVRMTRGLGAARRSSQFTLLGPLCKLVEDECEVRGDHLLKYLYRARHNMLHFACHCEKNQRGDMLLVSVLRDEGAVTEGKATEGTVIELETYKFLLRQGQFLHQPLVFLNACQSAGGADELRRTFNLPKHFVQREAAAVIATACPVPDLFAAAFARKFYEFFLQGTVGAESGTVGDGMGVQMAQGVDVLTIGEALRRTRLYFLKEFNNPLGLAYGLYSPAHYRLGAVSMQRAS